MARGSRPQGRRTRRTRSFASTRSRSAAPTCTSSRATSPRSTPGRVLGHEAVGTSSRWSRVRRLRTGRPRARSPASPRAVAAGSAGRTGTASARRRRLGPRPPDRRHPGRVRPRAVRRPRRCTTLPRRLTDEQALLLADILPTAYEVGVLNGQVAPGDTVADRRRRSDRPGRRPDRAALQPRADRRGRPRRERREAATPSAPTYRGTPRPRPRRSTRSPMASGPTSPSRRSACPRPSSCAPSWSAPGACRQCRRPRRTRRRCTSSALWIRDVTITTGLVDTFSTPMLLSLLAGRTDRRSAARDPPLRPRRDRRTPTTCSRVHRIVAHSRSPSSTSDDSGRDTAAQSVLNTRPLRWQELLVLSCFPAVVRGVDELYRFAARSRTRE